MTDIADTIPSPYPIQFGILLALQVPSIACSVFILYNLFFVAQHRVIVRNIVNHVLLCSVICDFMICTTELPITLVYLFRGVVTPATDTFCLAWFFYDYTIFAISLFLMGWNSIERFLLVFHKPFIQRHLLIKHYLPLLFCMVYPIMWYVGVLFIYRGCQNEFDYQLWTGGSACYQLDPFYGTFDWIVNNLLSAVVVILMNVLLLGRVVYQKCKMSQTRILRKNQLLILQLLLNACVYMFTWFPLTILGVIIIFEPSNDLASYLYQYIFNYAVYLHPLASPFIALITLPELRKKLSRPFKRQTPTVTP